MLMTAVHLQRRNVVELLLDLGADIDSSNSQGESAVSMAMKFDTIRDLFAHADEL